MCTVLQINPYGWHKRGILMILYDCLHGIVATCPKRQVAEAGLVVDGTSVSTEFWGVGSTAGFTCRLDKGRFSSCEL